MEITNYADMPKNQFWVCIQNGKAVTHKHHSKWKKIDSLLAFPTIDTALHFIENWDSATMSDFKEACLKEDYVFWVILQKGLGKYYADDIHMYAN